MYEKLRVFVLDVPYNNDEFQAYLWEFETEI